MGAPSTNVFVGILMRWYHGWNILAVAMLFQAVAFGIGIYSFTFWVAPWSEEFGVGRGRVMLVFVPAGGHGPASPWPAGRGRLRSASDFVTGSLCLAGGLALAGAAVRWAPDLIYGT